MSNIQVSSTNHAGQFKTTEICVLPRGQEGVIMRLDVDLYGNTVALLQSKYDPKGSKYVNVDPDNTYVISGGVRHSSAYNKQNAKELLIKTRKSLSDYIQVMQCNDQTMAYYKKSHNFWYNLETSLLFPHQENRIYKYPLVNYEVSGRTETMALPECIKDLAFTL